MDTPKDLYSEYLFTSLKKLDGEILDLELHLNKLQRQVKMYYFVENVDNLFISIKNELLNIKDINQRIRVNVFARKRELIFADKFNSEDLTYSIQISTLSLKRKSVKLKSFNFYQDQVLAGFKLPNYSAAFYLKRLAKNEGFDDIVYLTLNSDVLESSTSNLILKIDNNWLTPNICIYKGVSRSKLIRDKKISEKNIKLADLANASDAYLINSIEGFVKIESIDNKYYFENKNYSEVFND